MKRYFSSDKELMLVNITYDFERWARKLKPNAEETFIYCEVTYGDLECLYLLDEIFTANGLCYSINRLRFSDLFTDNV